MYMEKLNLILQDQLNTCLDSQPVSPELKKLLEKVCCACEEYQKELEEKTEALERSERKRAETEESLIKINKEMDRFVYSVSHDLRAPMATLSGLLNLAQTEESTEAMEHYLSLMRNSMQRMEHFIMNLLNYSRSNRQENHLELIHLKDLVEQTASSLRHLPNAFDIEFLPEYQLDFPFWNDLQKLRIIFTNLLSNAIQYHNVHQKRPFIRFKVCGSAEQVVIEIQDNGQGIEKQYHEKIFEMFFRGNESSKGNGLGLYIVKEMVQKLNGKISLISEPGQGSTFTLILPNMLEKASLQEAGRASAQ